MPKIVKSGIVYSSGSTVPAANIPYTPPSGSSSSATTAKAALDELITSVEGLTGSRKAYYTIHSTSSDDKEVEIYGNAVYDKYTHATMISLTAVFTGILTAGKTYRCSYAASGVGQQVPVYDVTRIIPVFDTNGSHPVIDEGDTVVISNASGAIALIEVNLVHASHKSAVIEFTPLITFGEETSTINYSLDFEFIGQDYTYKPAQ